MKKFSANYCKCNGNFIIKGIKKVSKEIPYISTIKIVKNIINRGNPTIMSKYLKEQYDYNIKGDDGYYRLLSNSKINWSESIKGSNVNLDNPALDFFENVIDEYLGEYSFVKQLILPEAPINDIITNPKEEYRDMSVDFYIPQINKVIEIDGKQHNYTKYEDRVRDALHKENVIRIKTEDIRKRTNKLENIMLELKLLLKNSDIINEYRRVLDLNKIDNKKIELVQIIRLELTMIEMLKAGILDFESNWNLEVRGMSLSTVDKAICDLRLWFKMIFDLQKINLCLPGYSINDNNIKNLIIDIDVLKKYDDSCCRQDIIYVRNDYFEDYQKNYYEVECDENYNYKLDYNNKDDEVNLLKVLSNIFEYESFREGQAEIIMSILNRRDTVGILPTGTGKSLCYQLSVLLQPAISLIICPLKSLIKDQKDNMNKIFITNNVKIDSTMSGKDKFLEFQKVKQAKYQMIWVSPERFQSEDFREVLEFINKNYEISYGVIDEVHCMSEWGHNFRTSYLRLVKTIGKYLPSAILIGLTATASDKVLKDLKIEFGEEVNIITTTSFIREELFYRVYNCKESEKERILFEIIDNLQKQRNVLEINEEESKAGIIFSPFAKGNRGCEKLANKIATKYPEYKEKINFFVGNNDIQSDRQREIVQDAYKNNMSSLLVATKAFGMGIDKDNIRYIIHFGIPGSIESLYQEVGRAGRDGKPAVCYIIHAIPQYIDNKEKETLFRTESSIEEIKQVLKKHGSDIGTWECGDVFDQLELFMKDKKQNEVDDIFATYQKIKGNRTFVIKANDEETLAKEQKNIYKLALLGIVLDWTVTYSPGRMIKGQSRLLTDKEIENNIEGYINKYEYNFSFKNLDEEKDKSIIDILNKDIDDSIYKYIKIISTWYHENILYTRRRAIEQTDEFISSLKSNEDCTTDFNKMILDYFRPNDYNLLLKYACETEQDYIAVLRLIYNDNQKVDLEKIKTLKISLDRLLVTNRYNSVLNLLSGILRIYLNVDNEIHDSDFEYALEKITKLDNKQIIFEEILKISSQMTEKMKNKLNEKLIKYFDSLDFLLLNYKYLQTKEVLNQIIQKEKKKILLLEGRVLNGFE